VTYNSVALTQKFVATQTDTIENKASGWFLIAPATTAHNIVVSWAASEAEVCAEGISFTGVDQITPLGTAATANAGTGQPTVNVSSASGEIVVDSLKCGQPTITEGAGQTLANKEENINFSSSGGVSTEAGAGTVTMSWTMGTGGYGDKWAIGGVGVKPVSAGTFAPPFGDPAYTFMPFLVR
jgi:hypothetical protein